MSSVIPARSASDGTEPIGILRLLFWLRAFAIVAQCAAVWVAHYVLAAPLPIRPIVLTVGALALWNVLGYRDLFSNRRVQHGEVALHLVVDVAAFTSMIYFTGGYTNPFVSLYLLPISLAAASLPAAYAWSIGAICGVCYSLVWRWHVPLPPVDARFGSDFDLHVAGMWVNFLIAAILIVFFVGRMARVLRWRDQELAALHETALRDQQIVELGTLAAGTAHELNTPLSTMRTLLAELKREHADDRGLADDLELLAGQAERCRDILRELVALGTRQLAGTPQRMPLAAFVRDSESRFHLLRPEVELAIRIEGDADTREIEAEPSLRHALINLLSNAADASLAAGSARVELSVAANAAQVEFGVRDFGAGTEAELVARSAFQSSKRDGLGLGLALAHATAERLGGELRAELQPDRGLLQRLRVPLRGRLANASPRA